MEGSHFIQNKELLKLSEQQFVDCDFDKKGNKGCKGGEPQLAFEYAKTNPIELESDYPYTSGEGKETHDCKYDASKGKVSVASVNNVPKRSNDQLMAAIAKQPVAVGIDASCNAFQYYD